MEFQKLVLFDVDGTLISAPNFLENYLVFLGEQLSEFYGKNLTVNVDGLDGTTERGILKTVLKRQGIDTTNKDLDTFFSLAGDRYNVSSRDLVLFPHVRDVIEKVHSYYLLGLCTGNPEKIARKKLEEIGMDDFFGFGGFGNESEIRGEIVNLAINRAKHGGWNGRKDNTYVVGDTTKDIESGKYAGVKTIGITTGSVTRDKLQGAGADFVIDSFSELEDCLQK